jgi:hypothetical protein
MELIKGFRPATELERAFAAEKARLIKAENDATHQQYPWLLNYSSYPGKGLISDGVDKKTATQCQKDRQWARLSALRQFLATASLKRARYFQPGRA